LVTCDRDTLTPPLQLPATKSTCGAFMKVTPATASVDTDRRTHVETSLRKLRRMVR
jgi:hypothetical protein